MKSILCFLLAFTVTANAEILAYKLKLNLTISGAGRVAKKSLGGYVLLDGDTGELTKITTRKGIIRTEFWIEPVEDHQIDQLNMGPLKSSTLITQTTSTVDTGESSDRESGTRRGKDVTD